MALLSSLLQLLMLLSLLLTLLSLVSIINTVVAALEGHGPGSASSKIAVVAVCLPGHSGGPGFRRRVPGGVGDRALHTERATVPEQRQDVMVLPLPD